MKSRSMHKWRHVWFMLLLLVGTMLLGACGKDYCSYGGCMREATSGGRCSAHQGLENDPYYGIPDDWY